MYKASNKPIKGNIIKLACAHKSAWNIGVGWRHIKKGSYQTPVMHQFIGLKIDKTVIGFMANTKQRIAGWLSGHYEARCWV